MRGLLDFLFLSLFYVLGMGWFEVEVEKGGKSFDDDRLIDGGDR